MGEVWLATELHLQRKVAPKLLPADLTRDTTRVTRFEHDGPPLVRLPERVDRADVRVIERRRGEWSGRGGNIFGDGSQRLDIAIQVAKSKTTLRLRCLE
jgi:hypothetical protein